MMMLGREVFLPLDLTTAQLRVEHGDEMRTDFAELLRDRMRQAHDRARVRLKESARRQKRNFDKKSAGKALQEGQFVWLFNNSRRKGMAPKLQCRWLGPFLITKKLSDVVFRIQQSQRSKPKVVHFDRLKPYEGDPIKPWGTEDLITVESSGLPAVEPSADGNECVNVERQDEVNEEDPLLDCEVENSDPCMGQSLIMEDGSDGEDTGLPVPAVDQVRIPSRRNPHRQRKRPLRYR